MAQRRVLLNGASGDIGRNFMHVVRNRFWGPEAPFQVVATNDLADAGQTAQMWRSDTVPRGMERHGIHIETRNGTYIFVDGQEIRHFQMREPDAAVYAEQRIDTVVDCTGRYTSRKEAMKHMAAGAGRVVVSAPFDDKDPGDITIVRGVNEHLLSRLHRIISNASCTTNSIARKMQALEAAFGIVFAHLETDHSYTNDQKLVAAPHKDPRRARRAGTSMIPTTTGAAAAVGLVLPMLAGIFGGFSLRVPSPNASLSVVVGLTERPMSETDMLRTLEQSAAERPGILRFSKRADLVSEDIVGSPESGILDAPFCRVLPSVADGIPQAARQILVGTLQHAIDGSESIGDSDRQQARRLISSTFQGSFFRTLTWYDERWGYSNRLAELTAQVAELPDPSVEA